VEEEPRILDAPALRALLAERKAGRTAFALVDVREAEESARGQIHGSLSAPLSALSGGGTLDGVPPESRVVLYCKAGVRARTAERILRAAGYRDLDVLTGGMTAWSASSDWGVPG